VPDPAKVCFLTQTTLSLDETRGIIEILRRRFPYIAGPKSQDICYATENRQLAVKAVAPLCQLLLVVGSQNSSNSKRLVEVCRKSDVRAYLLDDKSYLKEEWFDNVHTVSVTAGASAPEHLVQELIEALAERGYAHMEEMDIVDEDVRFQLPQELQGHAPYVTNIRPAL
jgi:4-hydroxy-3-methylbut-2-enyl diphosphate reductase